MVNTHIVALIAVSISVLSSATTVLNTALAAQDATAIMFQAKATIVHVDHALRHGSFDVNDTATVRWYQHANATDLNEDSKSGSYQNIELEVFELNSILAASRTCNMEVFNASPNGREGDMIYLSCSSFTAQASPIDGYGLHMFTVRLDDTTGSAISDDFLPLKLNLTEWTSAQLSLWYSKSSEVPLLILGSITSLTSSYSDSDFTAAPTAPDSTPLSPPFEINVVSTSVDSVTFSWDSVHGAAGYNIYRSSSLDSPFDLISDSLVNDTTYSDTGLSATTRYYYKVAAVDEEGVESDHSTAISIKTDKIVISEPATPPSEPATQEVNTPSESPTVPSPSASNPVPDDNFVAAPLTPPRPEFTTNTVLLGSIVVPVAATAVVLLWKKGAFRGRTRMEATAAMETETATPTLEEMNPENKDSDNTPSIAEEPLLLTTSTVAAAQRKEPDTMREFVSAESEAQETEVKVAPMLELKSEAQPKETELMPMLELKSEAEQTEVKIMPMLELKSEAEAKETEVNEPEAEQTEVKVMPMMELKSEAEAEQTEVAPVLELKSEVDTKLKEYFETIDKMQEAVAEDNYLYEVEKFADGNRKQKRRAKQKRRGRKQNRRVRKQKTRKQKTRKQKTRKQKTRKQKTRKQKTRKQKTRKQKTRKQKTRKQKTRKQKTRKQKTRKQKTRKQNRRVRKR